MNSLLSYFPKGLTASKEQIDVLDQIGVAFNSGKKFVIVCAPTGFGKSMLAKTLANSSRTASKELSEAVNNYTVFSQDYTGEYQQADDLMKIPPHGGFALTVSKNLQDQYQSMFKDFTASIKGQSNYTCNVDTRFTVDIAPCVFLPHMKRECFASKCCSYYENRNTGILAQFSALNYKMFLSLPEHVRRREFLICDEASELEDELVKQFSVELPYKRLDFCGVKYDQLTTEIPETVLAWLVDIKSYVANRVSSIKTKHASKDSNISKTDQIKLTYLRNLTHSIETVIKSWNYAEYIIDRGVDTVTFTPLKVDKLAPAIFKGSDKVLLMSATIINPAAFAKALGITEYTYIEAPSVFDPNRSKIFISNKVKLNYTNLQANLPTILKEIIKLCEHHENEKGIIHTHNNEICKFLKTHLKGKRFLFRGEDNSNEDILAQHEESEDPTILVSPSMTHGVDLKGDLARFQIIVKAPYQPLSNKRIKELFKRDPDFYTDKCLSTLVQASGRATRSVDDYSTTYALDGVIGSLILRHKNRLPKHFIARIQ